MDSWYVLSKGTEHLMLPGQRTQSKECPKSGFYRQRLYDKQTNKTACFEYLLYSTWVKNFGLLLKASTATLLKLYVNILGKYK